MRDKRLWRLLLPLMLAVPAAGRLQAQETGQVAGTVTNEQGQPVATASVVVQGTRLAVATGLDGKYVIPEVPAGTRTVVARLIVFGVATQVVTPKPINLATTVRVPAGTSGITYFPPRPVAAASRVPCTTTLAVATGWPCSLVTVPATWPVSCAWRRPAAGTASISGSRSLQSLLSLMSSPLTESVALLFVRRP